MVVPVLGIRNMKRCLVLAVLCLVVASVTTPQAQGTPTPSLISSVTATLNTVTVSVTTPVPTQLILSIGTDKTYGLSVLDRSKMLHRVTVRGLRPATTYYYAVQATPAKGRPSTASGMFATGPIGPATVTAKNGKILLNGVPFFPIMADEFACPAQQIVDDNIALGINVLDPSDGGSICDSSVESLHAMLSGKTWWLEHVGGYDAAAVQQLPELMNWQGGITFTQTPSVLIGCNETSTDPLYQRIHGLAKVGPVIYWLWLSDPVPSVKNCLDGPRLQNLFWTVVAAGGLGMKYITQQRLDQSAGISVNSDVSEEAGILAKQMATIGPAILMGQHLLVTTDAKGAAVKLGAWQYGGVVYIVAVNTANSPATWTFTVPSPSNLNTTQVLWENRNVMNSSGMISDQFNPLAVHIYKVTRTG